MSETSNPQPAHSQPPEEFHWAVTYLREDIQDIRNEIRGVHGRIDETNRSLSEQIEKTNLRIDEKTEKTNLRIDEKHELLVKCLDNRFALLMTTMVALAGVIVAVIKL
jgi:hypothetical protein